MSYSNPSIAKCEYIFKSKNNITVDEIVELLPLLIDAWKTPYTCGFRPIDEFDQQKKIPNISQLHQKIVQLHNEYLGPYQGLGRHFEKCPGVAREDVDNFFRRSEYKYTFNPQNGITASQIAKLLPLLIDAWNTRYTYELEQNKEIPPNSKLHKEIGKFPEELRRHFEQHPLSTIVSKENSFNPELKYKYLFAPEKEITFAPEKEITRAYEVAQILTILIEAWTNQPHASVVKEKKIPSDLNHKIDNLPKETKENYFKPYPDPELKSAIAE
jgi:hypothetical protein